MGTRHLEPRRGHDAAEKPASAASGILRRGDAADPSNVTASAGLAREPLPPVADVVAMGIWIWSFAGNTVAWRGQHFSLKDGKMSRLTAI